jgi:LuxR family maltose regulon positive regulatory protein
MSAPLLTTKLYTPPPRPNLVARVRLIERLNEGLRLGHKLTLISAPAGFGKTTLLSHWIADCKLQIANYKLQFGWLSLDEGDNDPARFLAYLVAALRMVGVQVEEGIAVDASTPAAVEALLTTLVNQVNAAPDAFVLVLDDYHFVTAQPVHDALAFLLDHHAPGGRHTG